MEGSFYKTYDSPKDSIAKARFFFLSYLLMERNKGPVPFGNRSPAGSTFPSKASKLSDGYKTSGWMLDSDVNVDLNVSAATEGN